MVGAFTTVDMTKMCQSCVTLATVSVHITVSEVKVYTLQLARFSLTEIVHSNLLIMERVSKVYNSSVVFRAFSLSIHITIFVYQVVNDSLFLFLEVV